MTPNRSDPMYEAEFENRLHQLIGEGRDGSAPMYGAFTVRSPDPDRQDYDIQITEVANRSAVQTTNTPGE